MTSLSRILTTLVYFVDLMPYGKFAHILNRHFLIPFLHRFVMGAIWFCRPYLFANVASSAFNVVSFHSGIEMRKIRQICGRYVRRSLSPGDDYDDENYTFTKITNSRKYYSFLVNQRPSNLFFRYCFQHLSHRPTKAINIHVNSGLYDK